MPHSTISQSTLAHNQTNKITRQMSSLITRRINIDICGVSAVSFLQKRGMNKIFIGFNRPEVVVVSRAIAIAMIQRMLSKFLQRLQTVGECN